MTDPLRRFARALVQRLSETPGGPHRAVTLEEVRSRLLPYRAYRSVLGFESVEDYDVVVLRLVGEEGGLVRTLPQLAAERCRAETSGPAPNLELLDQLADVTIQIGAEALARIFEGGGAPPAPVSVRDDLDIIERHLELEVREPIEVHPAPQPPPAPSPPPREPRPAAPSPEPRPGPVPPPPQPRAAPEPRPMSPAPEPRPAPRPEPRPVSSPEPHPAMPPEPRPVPQPEPRPAPPPRPQLKPRRPIAPPKPQAFASPSVEPLPPPTPPPDPMAAPSARAALHTPPADRAPSIAEAARMAPSIGGTCRSCRQSLPVGRQVVFCPWCGERQPSVICSKCNTELESQWKHCITCGAPVKDPD